ncbi:MAG: carbamate kinase [Sulfolobaceae archaeon]|nr:carbamate kinase [Sulfolobaceae archaeon]
MKDNEKIVIALGGNALLRKDDPRTFEIQLKRAEEAMELIGSYFDEYKIVLTHGNGPQVGDIVLMNESSLSSVPRYPLDSLVAMSQGLIGYILLQSYWNVKVKLNLKKDAVAIITRTLIDINDPANTKPSKPIGPFYSQEEAEKLEHEKGWVMKEEGTKGWRRVVPSPYPLKILEANIINELLDLGYIPIAVGGGGIPVYVSNSKLAGFEGVIDKDLASAVLAISIGADKLVILTDVDYVYLNYGKPNQEPLKEISAKKLRELLDKGYFPEGSMGPKVRAAILFVENTGKTAIISSLERARESIDEKFGTIVYP